MAYRSKNEVTELVGDVDLGVTRMVITSWAEGVISVCNKTLEELQNNDAVTMILKKAKEEE